MNKQSNLSLDPSSLRQKAETLLTKKASTSGLQRSEADVERLIHELEVHQIELEMQNEELGLAKEREAELAKEKYIELYDFAPSGYFTLSKEGEIIDLNLSGAKMLGKERAYLKNNRFVFFVTDNVRSVFNLFIDRVFNSKSQQTGEVSLSIGNSTTYVHLTGIAAENGEQCYVTAIDITDRKQAEESLQISEQRLKDVISSLADWLWEVDENGIYTYSSQKGFDLFGAPGKNVIGKTPFDFMPPEEAARVAPIFAEIAKRRAPIKDLENWNINVNGDRICLLTNGVPIMDAVGNFKGYRGIDKDITERKKAAEEIQKQNEIREQLIKHMVEIREDERALISREIHDQLGQSMTALKLDMNWLQANATVNPEIKAKLAGMVDLITATIGDVQRISSELRPGILDDLGLAAAIEWYAEEFEKRTKLKVIMDLDEVQTKSDSENLAIFRVLQEALTNIIRHAHAQTVHIKLHKINEHIVLDIEDDGDGMSIDKLKSRQSLGLWGMHDRIKQAGGTFDILCGSDAGTKVRICVPLASGLSEFTQSYLL